MARHFNAPVRGVFVANPGYVLNAAGVPRGAVISSVGGKSVAGLDDFIAAISSLPDGERATLRYSTLDDPKGSETRVMRMDRSWFPARVCVRDDATGLWPCRELRRPPAAPQPRPQSCARRLQKPAARAWMRSRHRSCWSTFDMPFSVAGITERNYHGTGVIVDAERGLVVVDRNTVPVAAGDVRITFGGSIEVPGKVRLRAPAAQPRDRVVRTGGAGRHADPRRALRYVRVARRRSRDRRGPGGDSRLRSLATSIASVDDVIFPLSRTLQFRDANLEVASLVNSPTDFDGVLVGKDGRVRALWSSFATEGARDSVQVSRGMPAETGARGCRSCAYRQAVVLARDGVRSAPDRGCPQARPARCLGRNASRRAIPRIGRCWPSLASPRDRRPLQCCARVTCCSPSTARR